jgi:hypothetical protein
LTTLNKTHAPAFFRNVNLQMLAVMLLIGVANILWAERLTVNGGFGWDGVLYGGWAKDFYNSIFVQRVPEYYAQRILPSAIVHYGLRLFRVPLTDNNIILGFDVYNLLLILLSVYVWGLIADKLQLSNRGKWLGFCFLFLNYAILKNNFYHSVLTDTSAFTLGLLMFYFFLTDKPIGLLAVIVAGAFTWPTAPYMAALLYVCPYQREAAPNVQTSATPRFKLHTIFAALVCVGALLVYAYLLQPQRFAARVADFNRALRIDMPVLYLSLVIAIVYLFFSVRRAAADDNLFDIRRMLSAIKWPRAVVAVLLLALLKFVVHRLASGEVLGWGFKGFIVHTFLSSLTEPFIFLVAHTVYYGPVILLLLFLWKPFCASLREYGLGFRMFVILNVILSINPQSRYQINVVTAFIIVLVRLLDRAGLQWRSLPFWALLCVFYSKVWYVFNTAPQVDDETMAALLRFPLQHYFMSSGPWMSHEMYLVQGGVVLLTGILLYFLLTKNLLGLGFSQLGKERRTTDEPGGAVEVIG